METDDVDRTHPEITKDSVLLTELLTVIGSGSLPEKSGYTSLKIDVHADLAADSDPEFTHHAHCLTTTLAVARTWTEDGNERKDRVVFAAADAIIFQQRDDEDAMAEDLPYEMDCASEDLGQVGAVLATHIEQERDYWGLPLLDRAVYLDRVVVHPSARGNGWATAVAASCLLACNVDCPETFVASVAITVAADDVCKAAEAVLLRCGLVHASNSVYVRDPAGDLVDVLTARLVDADARMRSVAR